MANGKIQKLNVITAVLVLILCGTVCRSYAIDCMDLWDEATKLEMIEDEKRYEARRQLRQIDEDDDGGSADGDDDENEGDDDDDHHDDDVDTDDEHGDGYTHPYDENDEEDETEQSHEGDHETTPKPAEEEVRRKRQLTFTGEQRPALEVTREDPSDDLEVAETHLFRPVFRYKSQYSERRRVRNNNFSP